MKVLDKWQFTFHQQPKKVTCKCRIKSQISDNGVKLLLHIPTNVSPTKDLLEM